MIKDSFSTHPYRLFGWALAGLLLLLVLLEGWRYAVKPAPQNSRQATAQTLDAAANQFVSNQRDLLDQSLELGNILQNQLAQRLPRQQLFESLQEYSRFWGASLYQGNQPIVWNDFSLESSIKNNPSLALRSYVEVQKQNNVLLWVAHIGFAMQTKNGTAPYHLFTAQRIKQTNALPIGRDREFNLFKGITPHNLASINIGIYESVPSDISRYRVLKSLAGDSVGVVYASPKNIQKLTADWHQANRFWRALYALFCFVVIGLLLYLWLDHITRWKSLLFQLLIAGVGWAVFNQIHIAEDWLPQLLAGMPAARILSYQMLCNFAVNGFFFLIIGGTLQRKLPAPGLRLQSSAYFTSFFTAIGTSVINVIAIILTLKACYYLTYVTNIPLLTLQIYPGVSTLLFYLDLGIMLLALTITLIAVNGFLLQYCRNHFQLVTVINILSFAVGLLVGQLFISELLLLNWLFFIAGIYFALVFLLAFFYDRYPRSMPTSSALRNAALYSFVIALAGSTVIYQAKRHHIDEDLKQSVAKFSRKQDTKAQKLTATILTQLHQTFKNTTEKDLQDQVNFIQGRFTQVIQSTIPPKSKVYSFDLQMIDQHKKILADYSTNLNSPNWVHIFDLRRLKTVMDIQQINKNTVRPIVQQPLLDNAEIYQTFYRGWIPIFGKDEQMPIAWILCSVYRERPNLNKPMRAVMASFDYQNQQDSYLIQQYNKNQLTKTLYQGIEAQYPVFNVLQPAEIQALQKDSMIFYSSKDDKNNYRNLLVKRSSGQVVKSSTILPGYKDILFSFFRLSCSLLIAGFIILFILRSAKTGSFALFVHNKRFQYRILDSFLLATLVFLILLVFVTHFAIRQQNKEITEQQLFEKLDPITKAAAKNSTYTNQLDNYLNISLDSLATPFNVDASFYDGRLIAGSTTPQIYQQHLLPHVLPYPVYRDLFLSQKRNALTKVNLNGQELLIGYRSILSRAKHPTGVIAIPTFVQSPRFNKQLLETTSYLIILYLFIFGLFIIATTFISRQLSRPLFSIQQGLNQISEGNLDTTIPVTSDDEIGSLATAYNTMVKRLKALQAELATTEREEAWKEMAQQVAHEIKNPLTPMKLNIQHLQRQLSSGEYTVDELKKRVNKITQSLILQIHSLNKIASDFSNFAKPIEEDFAEVNINKLIDSIAELYDHDQNVSIQIRKQALTATVLGARNELQRVFINLVKNAREAMGGKGIIILKTYVREKSIFIEVEDNGDGINEENKPKIFVPNFSTKSSGTGLGLAICKKVVEAHGGSISFASIKGKGTNFVVKLPLL